MRRPGTGRSSAKAPPSATTNGDPRSPIAEGGFRLAGTSQFPDPDFHAYRQDLADVALAGQVIASHYAEPLRRCLATQATLHAGPAPESESIGLLNGGDELWMLDDTRGWAWGYAGPERRVGYIRSDALKPC
jgi:hypothetical protein